MFQQVVVIGTDTEIGKTSFSLLLLKEAKKFGLTTLGLKPLSAGCELHQGQWQNEDALALQVCSSLQMPLDVINPLAYPLPVSPNIAAEKVGDKNLDVARIQAALQPAFRHPVDLLLIEGIGGVMVPLNANETFVDLLVALKLPVILVVGMKLGCLNHALLTAKVLKQHNIHCLGWVANQLSAKMLAYKENRQTLSAMLPFPLLAEVPFQPQGCSALIDHGLYSLLVK